MEGEVKAQVFLLSGIIGVLVALVVVLIVSFVNSTQRQEEIRKHYDEVSATYEILIDGNKVDADTINVDWYKVEIDDTQKRVFLTAKKERRNTVIPMTMPVVIH